ncbi:hypothetical protein GCM10027521_35810 [Amycolatopsis cihanbeyliensis]
MWCVEGRARPSPTTAIRRRFRAAVFSGKEPPSGEAERVTCGADGRNHSWSPAESIVSRV